MTELLSLVPEVEQFLKERSRSRIHKTDPEAWYADVLGGRWWSKQREVAWSFADNNMTLVKSCNGIGKSRVGGDLAAWTVAVNDPAETSVMFSAPIAKQIKTVLFRYLADNYGVAKARGFILPGRITQEPALKVEGEWGTKEVVQAKRPADANLVSSFQGIHDGVVAVFLDEAGGLPEDLWIGANAVTTNEYFRILAIGNPDELNTGFHRRFVDRDKYREWNPITISAYDSPNFTGEIIFPDDLERDRQVKSLLVQKDWAEMMERQAHPSVVRAKVYGEFPEDSDTSFFPQSSINKAYNVEIDPPNESVRKLGVDLSFRGEDKSSAYLNNGGKIRLVETWVKEDNYMVQARKVHQLALATGAHEVRVDASGAGDGVFSLIATQEEFADRPYDLYGVRGGTSSPDINVWAQARAWQYDKFREGLQMGLIDLDDEDEDLRQQLNAQTFSINQRGAFQITPKDKMRAAGLHSPDQLDAAIYSYADPDVMYGLAGDPVGTRIELDLEDNEFLGESSFFSMNLG